MIPLTQNSSEDPVQFVIIGTSGKNQGGKGTMKRDIGRELLESIEAIKNGKGKRVTVNLSTDVNTITPGSSPSPGSHAGMNNMGVGLLKSAEGLECIINAGCEAPKAHGRRVS